MDKLAAAIKELGFEFGFEFGYRAPECAQISTEQVIGKQSRVSETIYELKN